MRVRSQGHFTGTSSDRTNFHKEGGAPQYRGSVHAPLPASEGVQGLCGSHGHSQGQSLPVPSRDLRSRQLQCPPSSSQHSSYLRSCYGCCSSDHMLRFCLHLTHMGPYHSYLVAPVTDLAPLVIDSAPCIRGHGRGQSGRGGCTPGRATSDIMGSRVAEILFRQLGVGVDIFMFFLRGLRPRHWMQSLQVLFWSTIALHLCY